MFEVNIPKLKGKISERGYNNSTFSQACNIDRNTLTAYMKRPDKIPYHILNLMADVLCETVEEAMNIFFIPKLTQNESSEQYDINS